MRENAAAKARRYLVEGRVMLLRVDVMGSFVVGSVRGDHGIVYRVAHEDGGWRCTCPAIGPCAHLLALQLVVVLPAASRLEGVPGKKLGDEED
jgi:uncharacterized Zn finger protein